MKWYLDPISSLLSLWESNRCLISSHINKIENAGCLFQQNDQKNTSKEPDCKCQNKQLALKYGEKFVLMIQTAYILMQCKETKHQKHSPTFLHVTRRWQMHNRMSPSHPSQMRRQPASKMLYSGRELVSILIPISATNPLLTLS